MTIKAEFCGVSSGSVTGSRVGSLGMLCSSHRVVVGPDHSGTHRLSGYDSVACRSNWFRIPSPSTGSTVRKRHYWPTRRRQTTSPTSELLNYARFPRRLRACLSNSASSPSEGVGSVRQFDLLPDEILWDHRLR